MLTRQLPSVPKPVPRVVSASQQRPAVRGCLPLDASTRELLAGRLRKQQGALRTHVSDTAVQPVDAAAQTGPDQAAHPAAPTTAAMPATPAALDPSLHLPGGATDEAPAAAGSPRTPSHRHGVRLRPTQCAFVRVVLSVQLVSAAVHERDVASPDVPYHVLHCCPTELFMLCFRYCRVDRHRASALPFPTRPRSRRVGGAAGGSAMCGTGSTAYVSSISTLCATLQQGYVPVLDTSDTLTGIPTPPGSEDAAPPQDTAVQPPQQQLVPQQALKVEEAAVVAPPVLPPLQLREQQEAAAMVEVSVEQTSPVAQQPPLQTPLNTEQAAVATDAAGAPLSTQLQEGDTPQPQAAVQQAACTAGIQQRQRQDAAPALHPVELPSTGERVSSCAVMQSLEPEQQGGGAQPHSLRQGPAAQHAPASPLPAQPPDSLPAPPLLEQNITTVDCTGGTMPPTDNQVAPDHEALEAVMSPPASAGGVVRPWRSRSPPPPDGGGGDSSRRSSSTSCSLASAGQCNGGQAPAAQPPPPTQPAGNDGDGNGGVQASCTCAQPLAPVAARGGADAEPLDLVPQGLPTILPAAACADALAPAWCTPPATCRPYLAAADLAPASVLDGGREAQPPACSSAELAQTQHVQPPSQDRLPPGTLPLQPSARTAFPTVSHVSLPADALTDR